jgi:L-asparaginase
MQMTWQHKQSATMDPLPTVQLVSTGGTIAMKRDPVSGAPIPTIDGHDLILSIPEIGRVANVEVLNHSNIASAYLGPPEWIKLTRHIERTLKRPEISGVVVSHGTDTLEETAYWLDLTTMFDKPIVLIGAQRNASEADSDGPRNLFNAVRVAVDSGSRGIGVIVAMNNQISAARDVTKTHTMNVESFKCGDFGFLGSIDPDRIVYSRCSNRRQHLPIVVDEMPSVEIVSMYAGCDGAAMQDAVRRGVRGVVVQALGLGNVNKPLLEAIKFAIASGIVVVISSKVPNGRVLPSYGFEGGGKTLQEAGAIFADDLSPAKARILLMLLLQKSTSTQNEIQSIFSH